MCVCVNVCICVYMCIRVGVCKLTVVWESAGRSVPGEVCSGAHCSWESCRWSRVKHQLQTFSSPQVIFHCVRVCECVCVCVSQGGELAHVGERVIRQEADSIVAQITAGNREVKGQNYFWQQTNILYTFPRTLSQLHRNTDVLASFKPKSNQISSLTFILMILQNILIWSKWIYHLILLTKTDCFTSVTLSSCFYPNWSDHDSFVI